MKKNLIERLQAQTPTKYRNFGNFMIYILPLFIIFMETLPENLINKDVKHIVENLVSGLIVPAIKFYCEQKVEE